jgi:uncharacterized membrane protein
MAFCKSCGAYIPDGLSACLACGYDEAAQSTAAAERREKAAGKTQPDDLRDVMERHRRIQQEKEREWAERERARRKQQEENKRWAQEEYARRQAQREVEEEQRRQEQERIEKERREEERRRETQSRAQPSGYAGKQITRSTGLAALSYLDILFILPYFLTPDEPYAKYHAKQGLRLFLFSLATRVLKYITPFGWIFTLLHLYLIYKGISNALSGKKEPLPVIGTIGNR